MPCKKYHQVIVTLTTDNRNRQLFMAPMLPFPVISLVNIFFELAVVAKTQTNLNFSVVHYSYTDINIFGFGVHMQLLLSVTVASNVKLFGLFI